MVRMFFFLKKHKHVLSKKFTSHLCSLSSLSYPTPTSAFDISQASFKNFFMQMQVCTNYIYIFSPFHTNGALLPALFWDLLFSLNKVP